MTPLVLGAANDDVGYVACVDLRTTGSPFLDRIERLGDTALLSEVGGFRYVYANRVGERTHFLALWSDRELNLAELFPASGDAAGADVTGVSRPHGSRRAFSAIESATALGVVDYESGTESLAAAEQRYRRELVPADGRACLLAAKIGRAHVCTPVTDQSRIPSSA